MLFLVTHFSAAAAEHGCCAAAAASRRRELRLMTDVAESCAPFPLQLHHAHLQLHLLPLPLPLTDTDSTTVLDAHVFSPLHEFGASCPLPEIRQPISGKNEGWKFAKFRQEGRISKTNGGRKRYYHSDYQRLLQIFYRKSQGETKPTKS